MASALREWLPNIIQSVDIWMSDSDIDVGSRWGSDLDKELEKSQFGILCLTPESMTSTWIHYEAGALSKFVDKSRVCPYLLGLQPTDIKGPLVNFQAARANKEDTLKLIQTINRVTGDRILPEARVSAIFERFWPDLETALTKIPPETNEATEPSRSQEDMVEEILKIVRDQSIAISSIQDKVKTTEKISAVSATAGVPRVILDKNIYKEYSRKHGEHDYIIGLPYGMDDATIDKILTIFEAYLDNQGPESVSREQALEVLNNIADIQNIRGARLLELNKFE